MVTFAAVVGTVLIEFAISMATGRPYPFFVFVLDVLMPAAMGFPVAYLLFRQQHRLRAAAAELKQVNAELTHKVSRDHLTGFLNRETFFERTGGLRRRSDAGALLLIDADHFKTINDTHGHLVGDEALRLIAGAISRSVRDTDVLGRVGGEEFCVFLPSTERWEAVVVAERLRAGVEQLDFRPIPDVRHPLSVSIGAVMHDAGESMSKLMRRADIALYRAKASGRNMVVMPRETRLVDSEPVACRNRIQAVTLRSW
ncbi:GGDEF domain-containing protein [Nitratireductor sp. ZSWI3]|uniref:GGDEF domain-containing protein n=1 Tax=Nitratireductor sp. ZSWI3 TaxID=2966359 RepID=UPI00214FFC62|nr:GGDEF domain-containing protein [Nitratireductor sp. ZSWI3]MCR4269080.1 GGDEF domain-containing protein [Nitratireductor sp. ZSWI3]